jgi:HEPN domain-containing protein
VRREERLEVLFERKSFADVVREAQELIELCLKALLRISGIEPPRSHDVSEILTDNLPRLPKEIQPHVAALAKISKKMRRDRELSYYGSEDLTPSDFYQQEDAQEAFENAKWVYSICRAAIP